MRKINYLSIIAISTLLIGCGGGGSSSSKNDGKGDIDLAKYYPITDITKVYSVVEANSTGEVFKTDSYNEDIIITKNDKNVTKIETISSNGDREIDTIGDTNISLEFNNKSISIYRYVDVGDKIIEFPIHDRSDLGKIGSISLGESVGDYTIKCILDEKLNKFNKSEHIYSGDILKLECIKDGIVTININPDIIAINSDYQELNGTQKIKDISYIYLKEGLGKIADINEDCIVKKTEYLDNIIDDSKKDCIEKRYKNDYLVSPLAPVP